MIQYNPKDWFTFIFKFHKVDTFRILLKMIISIGIYCTLIIFIQKKYFSNIDESHFKNGIILHTLLGGVISFLLVFRTNSAYDRWWEGRKLWGELTNHSRNFAIKIGYMLPKDDVKNREFFRKIIPLFSFALQNHLLSGKAEWLVFDRKATENLAITFDKEKHVPIQITQLIFKHVHQLNQDKIISDVNYLLLDEEIKNFMKVCGACERIKNSPIPFSYSVFIKKFIFGYIMTMPFSMMFNLGYIAVPVTCFIFYVLASLELIAEEIEDPFGTDENDLPMKTMSKNIQKHVNEIFQKVY